MIVRNGWLRNTYLQLGRILLGLLGTPPIFLHPTCTTNIAACAFVTTGSVLTVVVVTFVFIITGPGFLKLTRVVACVGS